MTLGHNPQADGGHDQNFTRLRTRSLAALPGEQSAPEKQCYGDQPIYSLHGSASVCLPCCQAARAGEARWLNFFQPSYEPCFDVSPFQS